MDDPRVANTAPVKTETAVSTAKNEYGGAQNNTRSWNLGKYVLGEPVNTASCRLNTDDTLAACNRFIQVSDVKWKPTWTAQEVDGAYTAYNEATNEYDSHYLAGNYYQYNTATAGTGTKVTGDGDNAEASICPSGVDSNWVLPLSGNKYDSTSGSFKYLFDQYGVTNDVPTVVRLPLAFVRSADVNLYYGRADSVGYYGFMRSRTSYSSVYVYALEFAASVTPSMCINNNRYRGEPVRCLFLGE